MFSYIYRKTSSIELYFPPYIRGGKYYKILPTKGKNSRRFYPRGYKGGTTRTRLPPPAGGRDLTLRTKASLPPAGGVSDPLTGTPLRGPVRRAGDLIYKGGGPIKHRQ